MTVTTIDLTQDEPVLFRVASVERNTGPGHLPSDAVQLRVVRVDRPGAHRFGISLARYEDVRTLLAEAVDSQAVYTVDWRDRYSFPPRDDDRLLVRLLDAIRDRQIVSDDLS